ncbi:MAG: 1-(5-phosphoribosyl)-5-[(5-phosphoribosylamino)methylideneamino] imidazole-4-carboxamide isomerase [Geobacter sp.]|nr:1-(5-phosphoribosyl)-5-[(5-phosphoribosylamino)methylideneamino] imidazole-4-carboxamide isomerase [Geobacter sp.]
MIVIPAIDLKEGKCVRLEQGLMERDTVYSDNPAAQALAWQTQGAELLHIVDLDGAFAGEPKNRAAIESIVSVLQIPTQLGGGIRDLATIEAYLGMGVGRVIIGTAAQRNPELVREACARFPGRIVVGIDAKNGMVAVQGWAEVTDVTGVDLARAISIPVIASGGVSTLKDIENLMEVESAGISGAITGKAIYSGAINLAEAITLTKKAG